MRKLLSVVVLWLSLVLAGGATAEAQCGPTTGTMKAGPFVLMSGSSSLLYFNFTPAQTPVILIGHNVGASPPVYGYGNDWLCSAYTSTMASIIWNTGAPLSISHWCTFQTNNGNTCKVQGSDGLPVELMDFAAE